MNKSLKILLAFIIIVSAFTYKEICQYLGFGKVKDHSSSIISEQDISIDISTDDTLKEESPSSYFVSDSVYEWDDFQYDWVAIDYIDQSPLTVFTSSDATNDESEPIQIEWKQLMNIKYKLKYYEELETEMYAPIFSKALKAIDGKRVIIKGYIIPIEVEVESEMMALSANSYSSCFFCGKASPASVISLYLKKYKFYKADTFKKFSGTLHLNYDDPNEFYYILKDAVPVK
jgi:hypothetical protein